MNRLNCKDVDFLDSNQLQKAKHIARTLGMKCAAAYMRNRGWSLEAACWTLLRKESRDH